VLGNEEVLISIALLTVATMYSSVGHGGASGYLAILSLTSFALMEDDWLKQHAWSLNLIVAGLAFYRFKKAGHHIPSLSVPFILGGFPMAFVGGFLQVNEGVYDSLLSVVLILAGLRLVFSMDEGEHGSFQWSFLGCVAVGALIGLISGVVGIGGGVLLSPLLIILHVGRPKEVAATSALFIWINSAGGMIGSTVAEGILLDLDTLFPFSLAVLIGGVLGSRYGSSMASERGVRVILSAVLLIAASKRILLAF
tara:strand:- start:11 stop:769 length:759 start_codon:yes stop_codon:yes gene_type:complete